MNPRPVAWTVGILLILLGVAGFIPPLASPVEDPLRRLAGVGGPQILGLLPTSAALNIIHLALGLWGVTSGRRLSGALLYCRYAAILLALLFVFGLIPGPDNLFGMAPLYGNNLLLHGALALLCGLFGWLYRRPVAVPTTDPVFDREA